MKKKNEKLLRENEKLKNEKNQLRKLNMKNDKFSLMYREGSSILSNSNLTSRRVFTGTSNNNNYQKDMFKILGDVDSNSSKVETDNSTTSSKINKKNEGNKYFLDGFFNLLYIF